MGSIKTPSPSRMGWLTVCLVGVLLVNVKSMPLEEETELNNQDEMRDIFTRLFVESREGRDLDMEIDNTIEDGEDGENKAIDGAIQETNTQEISRFNNYIDAIYKRMNAALRAKLMDPMVLNLQGKDKKDASEKKEKDSKKRVERDVEQKYEDADAADDTDEEEMEMEMEAETEIEHRVGEPKSKQKGSKNKDKKEKREKNKNKNMKEKKDKTKKKEKKNKEGKEEKKSANKQKRKEEKEKAKKDKEKAKKDKEEAKAAKKLAKAEKADKKGGKSLKKGGNGGKKDKKEKNGKKDKKKNNNNKKEKKPKGKGSKGKARENKEDKEVEKESKVMGSLAGIATLRRSGDVTVMDEDNHKVVTSTFTVGPLQLEVSKTLGQGKSRTVKTAKATTDVMSGTMVLKVKPDGSAHVKKVVFSKPEKVDVKGSLSDNKPRSISYLKNSVNRMRPIAAQKILKTARYVLKAPATVKQ